MPTCNAEELGLFLKCTVIGRGVFGPCACCHCSWRKEGANSLKYHTGNFYFIHLLHSENGILVKIKIIVHTFFCIFFSPLSFLFILYNICVSIPPLPKKKTRIHFIFVIVGFAVGSHLHT